MDSTEQDCLSAAQDPRTSHLIIEELRIFLLRMNATVQSSEKKLFIFLHMQQLNTKLKVLSETVIQYLLVKFWLTLHAGLPPSLGLPIVKD